MDQATALRLSNKLRLVLAMAAVVVVEVAEIAERRKMELRSIADDCLVVVDS